VVTHYEKPVVLFILDGRNPGLRSENTVIPDLGYKKTTLPFPPTLSLSIRSTVKL
jgi:hypothetical protein